MCVMEAMKISVAGILIVTCLICTLQGRELVFSSTDGGAVLYINGRLQSRGPNNAVVCVADTYHLPTGYDLIAVASTYRGSDRGIIASIGDSFITDDVQWKCTNTASDQGWMTLGFKDTDWQPANVRRKLCSPPGISDAAQWIWTARDQDTTVYCRGRASTKRLTITADNIFVLYIDGMRINNLPNFDNYRLTDTVGLPLRAKVVAMQVTNTGGPSGLIASTSDASFYTDSTWKCTNTNTSGWMNTTFDDTKWPRAVVTYSTLVVGISSVAKWIWTQAADINIYCRSRITCNHTFAILEHTANFKWVIGQFIISPDDYTLDDCRTACINDPLCLGFQVLYSPSILYTRGCARFHSVVLKKNNITTFHLLADCKPDCSSDTWALKSAHTYVNGGVTSTATSLQGCQDSCSVQPTCVGVSYIQTPLPLCELVLDSNAEEVVGLPNSNSNYYAIKRCEAAIDGNWGEWTESSFCNVTSCRNKRGRGQRVITRSCDNPAPSSRGLKCDGSHESRIPCNDPLYCFTIGNKALECYTFGHNNC